MYTVLLLWVKRGPLLPIHIEGLWVRCIIRVIIIQGHSSVALIPGVRRVRPIHVGVWNMKWRRIRAGWCRRGVHSTCLRSARIGPRMDGEAWIAGRVWGSWVRGEDVCVLLLMELLLLVDS